MTRLGTLASGVKRVVPGELQRRGYAVRHRVRRLTRVVRAGGSAFCPCCSQRFRSFALYNGRRTRCRGCGSIDRHRLVQLFLDQRTDLRSADHVLLHVAAESCLRDVILSLPNVHYLSVDLEHPLADRLVDICDLPFGDQQFTAMLCNHVLEHVRDDAKAISELHRVLRSGGWAILQVPIRWDTMTEEDPDASAEERLRRFGQADHVRMYGHDYADRLRAAGFEVEVIDFPAQLPRSIVVAAGLDMTESVVFARRSSEAQS